MEQLDLRSVPTPAEILAELDKYIIGQEEAKKAVAIAVRNHFRRLALPPSLREEVTPKNILMIGPTGVGKTEIARRLARFIQAPFVKVEATKFTEVGYVGRDVESIIRDLVESSVQMLRQRERERVEGNARSRAEMRVLDLLPAAMGVPLVNQAESRADLLRKLRSGELDDMEIEVEVREPAIQVLDLAMPGMEEFSEQLKEMLMATAPKQKRRKRMKVKEALEYFTEQEIEQRLDMDRIREEARHLTENMGIVFLDEIDKIALRGSGQGPDVSREGVQRDLLPLVEGTTVHTKYGPVRTDHILFIAAGAFHMAKVSDLIPELQGRFPVRVELQPLTVQDYKRILVEPENALTKQYQWLLAAEGVDLQFTEDGIQKLAEIAAFLNEQTEDIGARRLHTVMEHCLKEISFSAQPGDRYVVDAAYVERAFRDLLERRDIERYIL